MALAEETTFARESANTVASQRVLIYGINYAPEPTGVGRYTGEIGSYLSQQGTKVTVVTAVPHYPGWAVFDGYANRYVTEIIDGATVTRCPLVLRREMRGVWRLLAPLSFAISSGPVAAWYILTRRPTTVLCVEPTLLGAPVALACAKLIGAHTVLHVQDLEIDAAFAIGHLRGGLFRRFAKAWESTILRLFDSIVTISGPMRDRLVSKGVNKIRLKVIRNWVNLDRIKPLGRASIYRAELGLSADKFVVQYAGNLGAKQGLDILLSAAERLSNNSQVVFVVAGNGPEERRLRARYGSLKNVKFLPIQPEHRLCELLNLADVHVLPQERNAADLVLPSKLGGMLASGKACIVMAEAGTELHDILVGSAILLRPGDSGQLAETIVQLAEQPDALPQVSRDTELFAELDQKRNLLRFRSILLEESV